MSLAQFLRQFVNFIAFPLLNLTFVLPFDDCIVKNNNFLLVAVYLLPQYDNLLFESLILVMVVLHFLAKLILLSPLLLEFSL